MSTRRRQPPKKVFKSLIKKIVGILNPRDTPNLKALDQLVNTHSMLEDSPVHVAVYKGFEPELRYVIDNIEPEERLSVYLWRNSNSFTALDEAVNKPNAPMTEFILSSLQDDDERVELLQSRNAKGWTALHRAVFKNNDNLLHLMFRSVREDTKRANLALTEDIDGFPILFKSLNCIDPEYSTFKRILRESAAARYTLLTWKDPDGNSILHHIILRTNASLLAWTLDQEPQQRKLELLRTEDKDGRTLLHIAAENSLCSMVRCVLKQLNSAINKFELIWKQDNRQQTALHYAARSSKVEVMEVLLEAVEPNDRIVLLQHKDHNGNTAYDEANRIQNIRCIHTINGSIDGTTVSALSSQLGNYSRNNNGEQYADTTIHLYVFVMLKHRHNKSML